MLTILLAALIALSFISPVSWLAVQLAALVRITSCPVWVSFLVWGAAELAVLFGSLLGVPQVRGFLIARFWCVLTRHRFQRLCWEARLHTRAGQAPGCLVGPPHQGR